MTSRALYRLKASQDVVARTPMNQEIEHLKKAMSIMMGKGMKVEEKQDGGKSIVCFHSSSNSQDMSATDMGRITRALLDSKSLLTINVEGGHLVFSFEVTE
jgi:hypothetical protein